MCNIFITINNVNFLLISMFVHLSLQFPHVLDTIETCQVKFDIKNDKNKVKTHVFAVPSVINVENDRLIVQVSLCSEIPKAFPNVNGTCKNVCIYDKSSKNIISNLEYEKQTSPYTMLFHSSEIIRLKMSTKTSECSEFDVIIELVASPTLRKTNLHFNELEECELKIEMLKPGYTPSCTYVLPDSQLVDFRPFETKTVKIPVGESETFRLPLCGNDQVCGFESSGCKVSNGSVTQLGTVVNRRIAFDSGKNQFKITSFVKPNSGRKNIQMEIFLKCNWSVPYFSNERYLKPTAEIGRKYKFEIHSSFGCLKISKSCLLIDAANDVKYDLRGLYKKDGYNVLDGIKLIKLNICGSLDISKVFRGDNKKKNVCKYAQVCGITQESFHNFGAIPSYEINDEHHFVQVKFTDGSNCNYNQSITFSSTIDLICSHIEKGPKLIQPAKDECQKNFVWETPKACPKLETEIESCQLSTPLGNVNLNKLYKQDEDYTLRIGNGKTLLFNICGNIKANCLNLTGNSSKNACLIDEENNTQHLVGLNNPKLVYTQGSLVLKYSGEKCGINGSYSLTINLICSSMERFGNLEKAGNGCKLYLDFHTRSACFSQDFPTCSSAKFDLRPLIGFEKNYEIGDKNDGNISYFINVCAPLINQPGTMFTGNSMVEMMNKSEPHVLKRFTSLGNIKGPKIVDGKLMIQTGYGQACKNGDKPSRSTFVFECSSTEETPVFVSKKDCEFQFSWKTAHACLVEDEEESEQKNQNDEPSDEPFYKPVQNEVNSVRDEQNEVDLESEKQSHELKDDSIVKVDFNQHECNSISDTKKFDMSSIETTKIETKNEVYTINFKGNDSIGCDGLICKEENVVILPFGSCPLTFSYENKLELRFKVYSSFEVFLTLICNRTNREVQLVHVTREDVHVLEIELSSIKTCKLFVQDSVESKIPLILVGIVVILGSTVCIALTIYKKKYFGKCSYNRVNDDGRNIVDHTKMM